MKVVQVKCPQCGLPIQTKVLDQLFYCESCHTLHSRNGGVNIVPYEIADVRPDLKGQATYYPFWRVFCTVNITSSNVAGGTLYKLSKYMQGGGNTGSFNIFVPAAEMEIGSSKQLAMSLTYEPPRYRPRMDFGGRQRLGTNITKEEAADVADFVIVTMEAEKPGVLQSLTYDLKVNDTKLIYLPYSSAPGLVPAW